MYDESSSANKIFNFQLFVSLSLAMMAHQRLRRSLTTVLTHATIVAAFIRAPQTPAAQLRRYVDSDDDNSHDADAATPTTTLTPLLLSDEIEEGHLERLEG